MSIMVYYYKETPPPPPETGEESDPADSWKSFEAAEEASGYYAVTLTRHCRTVELIGLIPDTGIFARLSAREIHEVYHYAMLTMGEDNIAGIDLMARDRLNLIAARRRHNPEYTI